jgi:ABC-type sugar transport system substrate-binding protein
METHTWRRSLTAVGGSALLAGTLLVASAGVTAAQDYEALGVGNEVPNADLCANGPFTFGIDVFSDTQDYAVSWRNGLEEVAGQLGCVELVTLTDNADPATAIANINTLLQQEVDGVILFQIIADAQPGIMDLLNAESVPAVSHAVPAPGAPFVSPSDMAAGLAGGEPLGVAAAERWPDQAPWLLLGVHPETGAVSDNRLGGIEEGVRVTFPDLPEGQVIEIDSQSTADQAFNETLAALAQIPVGEPIIYSGINDDVVAGMLRAIQQDGRIDDSLGVGMGGLFPSGVEMTCQNPDNVIGTVDFLPETAGRYMIPALIGMTQGVEVPDPVDMAVSLLTAPDAQAKYPDFEPCQG